jgi:TRAP-type C4-dicarboxylate transport system substrate-binding protein
MRVVRMSVATMLAALVALTACATPNRLSDPAETKVLTFAEGSAGGQEVNKVWAEEVERVSKGRIRIEFKYSWRAGEPQYEAGTIRDVQDGKVDMAGVGARVFDRIGYEGFQALLAPFLIDSYELEAKVFDNGIPDQMLAGMNQEGLVGLGILPGPMRRVVGLNDAFTTVKAFEGQQIAMNDSALSEETLTALGATARAWPAGGDLKEYDAVELQLSSVRGFGYAPVVDSVAADVNLWPRAGVLLISKARFEELSPEEQQILRTATDTLRAGILEDLGAEDQAALKDALQDRRQFPGRETSRPSRSGSSGKPRPRGAPRRPQHGTLDRRDRRPEGRRRGAPRGRQVRQGETTKSGSRHTRRDLHKDDHASRPRPVGYHGQG